MKRALVALSAAAALAGSSVALAAGSLTGIFTTSVKGKTPAKLNGDWAIQIKKSGDYQIAKRVGTSGQLLVTGRAKVARDRITFQKETGPAACKGNEAVGRYAWTLKGKSLTFQRLADKCIGRRTILGGKFTKVK
jgi:hypothetical protein